MLQKRLFSLGKLATNSEAGGKAIIYIRMFEGVPTYFPCEALRISDAVYEIISNEDMDLDNDATCIWEFFPGDKVRVLEKKETVLPFGGGVFLAAGEDEPGLSHFTQKRCRSRQNAIKKTFNGSFFNSYIFTFLAKAWARIATFFKVRKSCGCIDCQLEEKTIPLATELINSTFPNRKLYQLIFWIVESLGEISLDQLQGFENEIQRLCVDRTITQRRHPVIEKWLHKVAPSICDYPASPLH